MKTLLIISKPSVMFPEWDSTLNSFNEHLDFLGSKFRHLELAEEDIVLRVISDIYDHREMNGEDGALEVDAGYVFKEIMAWFKEQFGELKDGDEPEEDPAIEDNFHGLTRHYVKMYSLLMERYSKIIMKSNTTRGSEWDLRIHEIGDEYIVGTVLA